ncbi:MAG: hypothetical protein KA436_04945 [Oligoflexales bacterium]|nr:hypothetical protein [Oligoflexales bacterium]
MSFKFYFSFLLLWVASLGLAEVIPTTFLTPSHIYLLEADEEYVWGTYYFAVSNKQSEAVSFRTAIILPLETSEYQAYSGVQPGDLKPAEDGLVYLEKTFPPGLSLLGIHFKVKMVSSSHSTLSFKPPFDIPTFSIAATKKSGLHLSSEALKEGLHPMLAQDGEYDGLIGQGMVRGVAFQVQLEGLGRAVSKRAGLWWLGLSFSAVLGLSVVFFGLRQYRLIRNRSLPSL